MIQNNADIPAAIVSPPLRSNILPISLFDANRSRGVPWGPPLVLVLRSEISTSAETFFVRTLDARNQRLLLYSKLRRKRTEDSSSRLSPLSDRLTKEVYS